jgi:hypothetical protein
MAMLDHTAVEGLSAHSAQVIKGKLVWILQSAWGGVGQAAAQPLVSCAGSKNFLLPDGRPAPPETQLWTPELASMTQFFLTLFKFLPPLSRTLGAPPRGRLLDTRASPLVSPAGHGRPACAETEPEPSSRTTTML